MEEEKEEKEEMRETETDHELEKSGASNPRFKSAVSTRCQPRKFPI